MQLKPFGLLYEEILLNSNCAGGIANEYAVKCRVAKLVQGIEANEFHRRLMSVGLRHVMTTNYDYNLEQSIGGNVRKANLAVETKYSLFRRREVGKTNVWHIHGECDVPNTITLGYDQYAGYLQKLRTYATADRQSKRYSPFKIGERAFDNDEAQVYSWLDVFLRDDVDIVGLTLDYTEIDLWWALTYKARIGARKRLSVGRTAFHHWHDGDLDATTKARLSLLKSLGVEVHCLRLTKGREDAYVRFLGECASPV